jgi:serine/threonine-protein kinase
VHRVSTPPETTFELTDLFARLQEAVGDAYRLEREMAAGGMSRLFVATEPTVNRTVVIKVLPPEFASALSARRFKREVELTAHLQHPHILPVLSAGARDDLLYYVMPFITGESLRHRLNREARVPVADACRILREVADALAFAHAEGVVHRDIKPENILLQGGHALLADFGVAGAVLAAQGLTAERPSASDRLTAIGKTVGTPAYMAPEQLVGEREVDGRADIYSLGVVGYEMLTGDRPFAERSGTELLVARLTQSPPSVHERRPDAPRELSDVIAMAMRADPEQRFRWAAEMHDALEGVPLQRRPSSRGSLTAPADVAAPTEPAPATTQRPSLAVRAVRRTTMILRERRTLRWVAVAVAAIVVAGSGAAMWKRIVGRQGLEAGLVAVAPFDARLPTIAVWREGMVDLLSRNLDGAGPLRTVSPTTVVRQWGDSSRGDKTTAERLGRSLGAQYVVFGALTLTGSSERDSVRIDISLLDLTTGIELASPGAIRAVEGPLDRMNELTDRVTINLLGAMGQAGAIKGSPSQIGTRSVPAIKAFLEGESHFRRTQWDSAIASYEVAVREDSTFALALRRLGMSLSWHRTALDTDAHSHLERAGRFNRGLSARDSLLVAADSVRSLIGPAEYDPDYLARTHRLFSILDVARQRYGRDPEVQYALGDAHYHFGLGPTVSIAPSAVLEEFGRAIALDSSFAPSYSHAVEVALALGDTALALRHARKYLSLQPTDIEGVGIGLAARLVAGDAPRGAALRRALDSASVEVLSNAWLILRRWTDSSETAVAIARALAERSAAEGRGDSAYARARLATQLAWRGHVSAAARIWDALGNPPHRLFAEMALLGAIPPGEARRVFASWVEAGRGEAMLALPWWAARGGGDTAAIRALERRAPAIHGAGGRNPATGASAAYDTGMLQAYLALARGDSAGALARMRAIPDTACVACVLDRLTEARLLATTGGSPAAADMVLGERLPTLLSVTELLFAIERARVAARMQGALAPARRTAACALVGGAWRGADEPLRRMAEGACAPVAVASRAPGGGR